jgi:hypothetical protein
MVSSGYKFGFDRAADNSPSIETALTFIGWGCFDYMITAEHFGILTPLSLVVQK